MPLALFLLFIALACWAFAWVRILPSEGHLLASVQLRLRLWYRGRYGRELEEALWWSPIWGCPCCCAGQLSFWIYPIRFFYQYDPLLHLCAVGVCITTAGLLLLLWNQHNS